ncbi:MAG: DUF4345 family protein [Myxococcota bacterium]
MSFVRIAGIALAALGVVAAIFPHWFPPLTGASAPAPDAFEAVERRVRAGMVLGVGLALVAVPTLRPWSTSIPTAIVYFVTGALVARLFGLVIDGAVPKQWFLVAVEAVVMVVAAGWLWQRTPVSPAHASPPQPTATDAGPGDSDAPPEGGGRAG